jgi:hypothetical protein
MTADELRKELGLETGDTKNMQPTTHDELVKL